MSVFHCNGCNQYIDSDYDGHHVIDNYEFCDNCEFNYQREEVREYADQFIKMIKLGML